MEFIYSDYSKNFIGHGFLAVDFFFCLSGFVMGYAYDDRIGKTGIWAFFKTRLIRLHPLVILGSILGLFGFLLDPWSNYTELYGTGKIVLIFISSILLIPFPVIGERGFGLFSFNAPSWSLFLEYVANIFYALILYRVSRLYLSVLVVLSAAALCIVGYHAGTLIGGWGKDNIWDGFARVSYSFLAGLLVYRSNWTIKNKLGFTGISFLLLVTFIMPYFKWNWLAELLVVVFYFPFIIVLGKGAGISGTSKKYCSMLGKISYPLYMTHIAGVWVFGNYYYSHRLNAPQLFVVITVGTIALIALAYVFMILYDNPFRRYLNNKLNQTQ